MPTDGEGPDDVGSRKPGGRPSHPGRSRRARGFWIRICMTVCHLLGRSLPGPARGVPGSFPDRVFEAGTGGTSRPCHPGVARDIRHLVDTAVGARGREWAVTRKSRCPAAGGRDAAGIAWQIALRAEARR